MTAILQGSVPFFIITMENLLQPVPILTAANLVLIIVLMILLILLLRRNRAQQEQASELGQKVNLLENENQTLRGEVMRTQALVKEEVSYLRQEHAQSSRQMREEVRKGQREQLDSILGRMLEITGVQNAQMETFAGRIRQMYEDNENRLESMRTTLAKQLEQMSGLNQRELQEMRLLVNEKLQESLDRRLGESFQLVSQQLEAVHKGLGEMQTLAVGVGDLKKVLTNVKNRGLWGEMQLGNLLEDILTPEQYAENVATRPGASERVEFAVRLPGKEIENRPVWLPIDSKFPQESYLRLLEALDEGDRAAAEAAGRELENRIRIEAKTIREKYVAPPYTTDFAVMFLPTESLYAEVVRRPGLLNEIQSAYRVNITGPTTMAAMLNSFAIGFRTLIIEEHSEEIWQMLGSIKTEFRRFGELLDKTRKKLEEASNSIDKVSGKTRTIEKKLKQVQELPFGVTALPEEKDFPENPEEA